MHHLLNTCPEWLLGMGIVCGAVGICVFVQHLLRRRIPHERFRRNNEVAGFIYAVLGVIYGVVVGLVLLAVYEDFARTNDAIDREANAYADLWRDAVAFPGPVRTRVHRELSRYADAVVTEEWPAMRNGGSSDAANRALDDLYTTYASFEPPSEAARVWYAEALSKLNQMGEHRRFRLLKSAASIPAVLWVALLVGGFVTVGFALFFSAEGVHAQLAMTGSLATVIALVLFTVLVLDNPFSGTGSLHPDALVTFQQRFARGG
jgi:hypothetical protein